VTVPDTASFYDELAPFYHLLYGDWDASIERQGTALSHLLQEAGVASGESVLDAACGVGTQTLGLARNGYRMEASDLSAGALVRLRAELARRALGAETRVDDLRTLAHATPASVAALIACDNSIPHLLSDAEILSAFQSCLRSLRPGGIAVFSVRDYAAIERRNPDVRPYGLRIEDGQRFLAVQVWEWDGDHYDLRLYLTSESAVGECRTRVLRSRYYAVPIAILMTLMADAGFVDVVRRDDVLFQPVLTGRRAHG
jgi:SAM-dependent methyltransferase